MSKETGFLKRRVSSRAKTRIIVTLFVVLARLTFAVEILEETVEQKCPLAPDGSLSITNIDGVIRIYSADVSEVSIQAIKKAYTTERLKGIAVKVKADLHQITIETIFPPKKGVFDLSDRSGTVEYSLIVPQTIRITKLELTNGEVLVAGLRGGSATAHLVNGWMAAHDCFGDLDLTVVNGRLDLVYDWWEGSVFSADAHSTNATIAAILPSDASVTLKAKTVSGRIGNDLSEQKSGVFESIRQLNIEIGGEPRPVFNLSSMNGNIRIGKSY